MAFGRQKQGETIRVQVREGMSWTRAGLWGIAVLMGASFLGLVGAYGPGTEAPAGGWAVAMFVLAPLFGFPFGWFCKLIWKIFRIVG